MNSTSRLISASVTRPNDTTAYADGDVIANGTPVPLEFEHPGLNGAGFAIVQYAQLVDSASQSTKLDADLWLFSAAPAVVDADNAAWTPTDADLANLVTVVEFRSANWRNGDATAGSGGNAACQATNLAVPVERQNLNTLLYGVLVARNAYVPIAVEEFTVTLAVVAG